MMNVGLPSANFVDCKSTYRPFVLFSKGVAPQDEWKTLRIVKPQCNTCLLEKQDPSYRSRRPSPYSDNREKEEELSKPIKVTKKVITSITIDKPIGFIDNDITEKALAIIGQTNNEDTSVTDMTVDLSIDEVKENDNKTEEKKL